MRSSVVGTLSEFFDQELGSLARLAAVLTLNPRDAEDLLQQSALRVHQKWALVRKADDPAAYARRLMVNEFRGNWRRKQREQSAHVGGYRWVRESITDDHADHVAQRMDIAEQLLRLTPRRRAAIALRYLEDRPDGEIASILNCAPATVRSLIRRGLEQLRHEASEKRPHRERIDRL